MTNFAGWLSACLLLSSCASPLDAFSVDYGSSTAKLGRETLPVALSYRGPGGKPRSNRTPVGEFTIIGKEPHHRFGPVLRLGGVSEDGYEQDGRGILIHKARWQHTHGCIGILTDEEMRRVFDSLEIGDRVRVVL